MKPDVTVSADIRRPLGAMIALAVRDYMRSPEHRAAFEAWYLAQYGKPYDWKRPGKEHT